MILCIFDVNSLCSNFAVFRFLANGNVRLRLLYFVARLSVSRLSVICLSTVTFVCPTQATEIFGNFSMPFGTLGKILRRSSQGNPSVGVKQKTDFGPVQGYISETVEGRIKLVSITNRKSDMSF